MYDFFLFQISMHVSDESQLATSFIVWLNFTDLSNKSQLLFSFCSSCLIFSFQGFVSGKFISGLLSFFLLDCLFFSNSLLLSFGFFIGGEVLGFGLDQMDEMVLFGKEMKSGIFQLESIVIFFELIVECFLVLELICDFFLLLDQRLDLLFLFMDQT